MSKTYNVKDVNILIGNHVVDLEKEAVSEKDANVCHLCKDCCNPTYEGVNWVAGEICDKKKNQNK